MLSMDKKYSTRDGRPVRLLCLDGPNPDFPVIGFVGWNIVTWTKEGYWSDSTRAYENDLIEVKPEKVVYGNVYKNGPGWWYEDMDAAVTGAGVSGRASDYYLGLTKMTLVEGEPPKYEFIPKNV